MKQPGSSSLVINTREYKGWGIYEFKLLEIIHDGSGCPESARIHVRENHMDLKTINPSFTTPGPIQDPKNTRVGLFKVMAGGEAEVWIKEMG